VSYPIIPSAAKLTRPSKHRLRILQVLLIRNRRVGQLEEKIDGIMSLLNASRQLQSTPPASESPPNPPQPQSAPLSSQPPREHRPWELGSEASPSAGSGNPATDPSTVPYSDSTIALETIEIVPNFSITHQEADRLLDLYRTTFSVLFPFVPIPPPVTALALLEHSPFLFRTIIQAVAPQNGAIQRDVSRWFREYIAQHMIVNQEKRLEILQALLVYLAW
jgi:hypothetical protein